MEEVRILTHESVVHFQLMAIEKLLKRNMDFTVTLNQRSAISNIQFTASEEEIAFIKKDLGYKVYREKEGNFFLFDTTQTPAWNSVRRGLTPLRGLP